MYLIWEQSHQLYTSWWNGSSWQTAQPLAETIYNYYDLAVDSAGTIFVAWRNNSGDTQLASRPAGGSWTAPETLAWRFWGGNLSLVIDENDQPHVIQTKGSAIYEITRASEHGATKRYPTGTGHQLASRINGMLYYHLLYPTGTSLTMVDDSGNEAAHLLYDAYGGGLTGTFTAPALAIALANQGATPDPDTGLAHLGNGRYYDPVLGRPLQPNPAGGPPTVPQALNRDAATSLGQPARQQYSGPAPRRFQWPCRRPAPCWG